MDINPPENQAIYDTIGIDYANLRRPDPRIAKQIFAQLSNAESILNIGAGAGSYEPKQANLVAVEPSIVMIKQRGKQAAPVVQAAAENLPFANQSVDTTLAVLTLHHWTNLQQGLNEIKRVTKNRVVIVTADPSVQTFWLADYLPEITGIDQQTMPKLNVLESAFNNLSAHKILIPHDCIDGFLCAYWRRPEAYLDEKVRGAISSFAKIDNLQSGLDRLKSELDSGLWHERYGHFLSKTEFDFGYRLIVADTY